MSHCARKHRYIKLILTFVIAGGLLVPTSYAHGACIEGWAPPRVNIVDCAIDLGNTVLTGVASFVSLGGSALDGAIKYTVIEMSTYVESIDGIETAWRLARDLANMSFIFILVWIAIRTILGIGDSQNKQALAYVIVIGLVMNFSLFFTQVIIDASNILALTFYDDITTINNPDQPQKFKDIILDVTSLPSTANQATAGGQTGTSMLVQIVMGIILMLIVAFLLLAAAGLMVLRFGILILLMILSPLAFAAFILPKTQSTFFKWLQKLISECFWLPMYFILFFIATTVLKGYHDALGKKPDLSTMSNDPTGTKAATTFISFALAIILYVAALYIAKSMGASGAGGAVSIGSKWANRGKGFVTGAATGAAFGVAGMAGRNTIGRGSRALGAAQDRAEARLQTTRGGRMFAKALNLTGANRGLRSAFRYGEEKAKFGSAKSLTDAENIQKAHDQNIQRAQTVEEVKEGLKSTTPADVRKASSRITSNILEKLSVDELENAAEHLDKNVLDLMQKSDKFTEADVERVKNKRYTPLTTALVTAGTSIDPAVQAAIRNLHKDEISTLPDSILTDIDFARHLSAEQLKSIKNSQSIDAATKVTVQNNFDNDFTGISSGGIKASPADIATRINKMTAEDLAMISKDAWDTAAGGSGDEMVKHLDPSDLSELHSKVKSDVRKVITEEMKKSSAAHGTAPRAGTLDPKTEAYVTTGTGKEIWDIS